MSHAPLSPPLVATDGRLRTILERADRFPAIAAPRSPNAPPSSVALSKHSELLPMAGWPTAMRQFLIDQKHLLTAYSFGFMASMAVVLLGVAVQSSQIVTGASAPEHAILAVVNRTSAFAAAPLMAVPQVIEQRQATIKVAGEIEAQVGHAVPFPIDFSPGEHATQVRISDLPPYAGLSAGVPEASGAWLVDPEAALGLRMTAYAAPSGPQDVSIEWLDADGRPIATARTRVTVSAAATDQQPLVATPAPTATPVFSEVKTIASATVEEASAVAASPIAAPRPVPVTADATAASTAIPAGLPANEASRPDSAPLKAINAEPKPAPARIIKAETKFTPAPVRSAAAEPKPVVSRLAKRARQASPGLVAQAPIAVPPPSPLSQQQQRLPWSHTWMRSTLGMGPNGP